MCAIDIVEGKEEDPDEGISSDVSLKWSRLDPLVVLSPSKALCCLGNGITPDTSLNWEANEDSSVEVWVSTSIVVSLKYNFEK